MPDLATPQPPEDVIDKELANGVVLRAPDTVADPVTVTIDDKAVIVDRWQTRGATIPAEGDPVLVGNAPDGEPWIVAWWPLMSPPDPLTVTGSRDGNDALTSLLTALGAAGIIEDETTA